MTDKEYLRAARYTVAVLRAMTEGTEAPPKPEEIPWADVYNVSNAHSLASAVFKYAEQHIRASASQELLAVWLKQRQIEFAKNIRQTDEFRRVTALFSENAVRFLPLKGFLLKKLWPSPELRTMADMDMLVAAEDFERASQLLVGYGYVPEKHSNYEVHTSFDKPPFLHVELHRMLYSGSDYSFDEAIPRDDNPYWYLMRDVDFFAFNIKHAMNHYEKGGCGIRAVLDHFLYRRANPSLATSPALREKLSNDGSAEFAAMLDMLSDMWFAGKEPEAELSEFELYTATGGTYGTVSNMMYLGMQKKGRTKQILTRIFPPPAVIMKRYKWVKRVPLLLPIGYIWRIAESSFNGTVGRYLRAVRSADERREDENKENGDNGNGN